MAKLPVACPAARRGVEFGDIEFWDIRDIVVDRCVGAADRQGFGG
jgi:hypothetical protein